MDGSMTDKAILEEAKENYKTAVDGWDDIYKEARNDLKFTYDIDGGQWDAEVLERRKGRPCITVNKLQKFVRQMRGDFMANRPTMKVIPADDKADVRMAQLYNGIIRQIEYLSSASVAYDTAYANAVASSVGYYRLITKYSDDNSFNQDIYIKRVLNPFSVRFDPYAVEFNLEDARYCFIEDMISKENFEKDYPDVDMVNFSNETTNLLGEWLEGDNVKICEYFKKEPIEKKIVQLADGQVIELTKDITPELITYQGGVITRERKVQTHIVKWYKITGADVLEKTTWAGKDIPVIPMFGDEVIIDGKRYYLSLIRGAKGSQQMYNYWASSATENLMQTPKTPFILEHRQIKGFENEWADVAVRPVPYLRYAAVPGLQKPSREPQPQIPSGIVEMQRSTAYDIEDHLGRYEASKGEAGNERSGKAIIARIAQSDKGTFTFVDNASRSIIAGVRQIIDLIPKIYDTPRALTILGESGDREIVNVNEPAVGDGGEDVIQNDLTVGKYDVIASIGASFSSKREESVAAMEKAMQYAPALANTIAPLYFKYSDFEGAQEIASALGQAAQQLQAQEQPQ